MKIIKWLANITAKLLRIVERWTTKKTIIEWYESECKKYSLVIFYVVYKGEDGSIWTYIEQIIIRSSLEISPTLEEIKKKIGFNIDSGYIVVEDKLIKDIINQHLDVR